MREWFQRFHESVTPTVYWILFAAVSLPLSVGLLARALAFKRDDDDELVSRRHVNPDRGPGFDSPEPKLRNEEPWDIPEERWDLPEESGTADSSGG